MINVFNSPIEASSIDEFHEKPDDGKDLFGQVQLFFFLSEPKSISAAPSSNFKKLFSADISRKGWKQYPERRLVFKCDRNTCSEGGLDFKKLS